MSKFEKIVVVLLGLGTAASVMTAIEVTEAALRGLSVEITLEEAKDVIEAAKAERDSIADMAKVGIEVLDEVDGEIVSE